MTTYRLVRTTPEGQERVQQPFSDVHRAATAAMRVLTDNTATSRKDANAFAGVLGRADIGTEIAHAATGYMFRIEERTTESIRGELLDRAAKYLTGAGITVLDRDWYHGEGIVDIAAEDGGQFVIVRVLAHPGRGKASPQVSPATVRRMRQLAADWMTAHGTRYDRIRADSIVILALPLGQYDLTYMKGLETA